MKDSRSVHKTPEYKARQSAMMKEFWRRKRIRESFSRRKTEKPPPAPYGFDCAAAKVLEEKAGRLSGPLKYVADDNVTANVEILRKLMDKGELAQFLTNKAHAIIRDANNGAS